MKSQKPLKIKDDKNIKPIYMNGMRVGIGEDVIQIEFASIQKEADEQVATIESKVCISPTSIKSVVKRLISVGVAYEKKYNRDIGMGKMLRHKEEEKE